jgi:hypothetical protein
MTYGGGYARSACNGGEGVVGEAVEWT